MKFLCPIFAEKVMERRLIKPRFVSPRWVTDRDQRLVAAAQLYPSPCPA